MKVENLRTRNNARTPVPGIYKRTKEGTLVRDFNLTSQIQRAAVSLMTNLAEGFERQHVKEKLQFYDIVRASTGEVRSLLYVISDNYPERAAHGLHVMSETESEGK